MKKVKVSLADFNAWVATRKDNQAKTFAAYCKAELNEDEEGELELLPKDGTKFDVANFGTSGNPFGIMSAKTIALFGCKDIDSLATLLDGQECEVTVKNWSEVSPKLVVANSEADKEKIAELVKDGKKALRYEISISCSIDAEKARVFTVKKFATLLGKGEMSIYDKTGFAKDATCTVNFKRYDIGGNISIGLV